MLEIENGNYRYVKKLIKKYLLKIDQGKSISVNEIIEDFSSLDKIDYEKISKIVEKLEKMGANIINKEVLQNAVFIPVPDDSYDDVLTTSNMRFTVNNEALEWDESSPQAIKSIGDAISLLIKDINNYPVLTPKEENELAVKMAMGDKQAKDKLILSNV
ncbi:MAG: hypothetical protein PWQ70_3327 [Clostridiales bacterium]|nr:hypothetical protein [Clostridiales bacterium]